MLSGFLSKIFSMSNIGCLMTAGFIGQPDEPWLTNGLNSIMSAVNMSLTTVQLKDEL